MIRDYECSTCSQKIKWAKDPIHCEGSAVAWQVVRNKPVPHHGNKFHPPCWRCGRSLGCDQCAGAEPLCLRCGVWATPKAFAAHGPLLNTPTMVSKRHGLIACELDEYPEHFRRLYHATALPKGPTTGQVITALKEEQARRRQRYEQVPAPPEPTKGEA